MIEPWFDPASFGAIYGSVVGGVGGTLGGLLGALAGVYAPRGIGKKWILPVWIAFLCFGASQILFGAYALLMGQPFPIWFFPLQAGAVITIVFGVLYRVLVARYREAETRRMQARELV